MVDLIKEGGEALASQPNVAGVKVLAQELDEPSPALSFMQLGAGELSRMASLAGCGRECHAAQPAGLAWGLIAVLRDPHIHPAPPS